MNTPQIDDLAPVTPIDQPDYGTPQADAGEDGGAVDRAKAGYTGSETRCLTCNYFDDEKGSCKKHGFEVEEGGHCTSWEPPEAPGGEGGPRDFDDDMEPFEEGE